MAESLRFSHILCNFARFIKTALIFIRCFIDKRSFLDERNYKKCSVA